jgi:hypothetical protein
LIRIIRIVFEEMFTYLFDRAFIYRFFRLFSSCFVENMSHISWTVFRIFHIIFRWIVSTNFILILIYLTQSLKCWLRNLKLLHRYFTLISSLAFTPLTLISTTSLIIISSFFFILSSYSLILTWMLSSCSLLILLLLTTPTLILS